MKRVIFLFTEQNKKNMRLYRRVSTEVFLEALRKNYVFIVPNETKY